MSNHVDFDKSNATRTFAQRCMHDRSSTWPPQRRLRGYSGTRRTGSGFHMARCVVARRPNRQSRPCTSPMPPMLYPHPRRDNRRSQQGKAASVRTGHKQALSNAPAMSLTSEKARAAGQQTLFLEEFDHISIDRCSALKSKLMHRAPRRLVKPYGNTCRVIETKSVDGEKSIV